MGVSASSPSCGGAAPPPPLDPPLHHAFSSPHVDKEGRGEVKKPRSSKVGGSLSTLRKRFARRRRTSKGCHDHAQVFRDLISEWSPRDVLSLAEEYESLSALKEVWVGAEGARPPSSPAARDLGLLFRTRDCSDINLIYQGTVFGVHRAVLAARCPFFREMLASLSAACTEVAVDIDIAGVSVPMFGELLRYLYTGELETAAADFHLLLQLSEQFGIPNPLEQDLKYLLETGIYSDISLSFTSGAPGVEPQQQQHSSLDPPSHQCRVCHSPNEFWCHRAILAARSPFFRSVIHRQRQRAGDNPRILLDDGVIPRRYACLLLRAVYQDSALEFGAVLPEGSGRQSCVEEAMQLYEVARFIEMDALVHSCEDFLVESLSVDTLLPVLRWASLPHGSRWVYRQAVHFVREEFLAVAHSPALLHLEKAHLVDALSSDFLQAGELEVLQAVLKWGEHQLFKRIEEREPNLVSHTAHSVSRRGLRRRDLSDTELRDILCDLLPCVRIGHVLPQDSELVAQCVRRGLVSTPPPHMLGDELPPTLGGKPPRAWVRGRNSHGLYVKPRLFTPFVEEAKAWLEEQLGGDAGEVLRGGQGGGGVWHISPHIPDTLYMEPLLHPPHHHHHHTPSSSSSLLGDSSSAYSTTASREHLPLDESTLRQMKQREKELRCGGAARRAYSAVRNHCDVTKLLQLRVVREFGLPDRAMELLHRTSYQGLLTDPPPPPPPPTTTTQMSRSCCSDHLNEVIPDIAMATSLLEQMQLQQEEEGGEGTNTNFSLRMF